MLLTIEQRKYVVSFYKLSLNGSSNDHWSTNMLSWKAADVCSYFFILLMAA